MFNIYIKILKICFLCVVLFACAPAATSDDNFSVKSLFPKPQELPGGNSAWIVSGVSEEKRDKCSLFTNSYAYYSDKGSVLMGMERSNSYAVSVRVFACNNFLNAINEYNLLLAAENKLESKKKSAPVAFGERGVLTAVPVKEGSRAADFYLTYLMRNFIIQVYSNDGFAQMDMAGEIERRLRAYFIKQGAAYFINKINLEIKHGSLKNGSATVSFAGNDISSVIIDGVVYDGANKPVEGAEIMAKETGQKTVTDKNGVYRLEVSAGQGRSVSLTKIIFMDNFQENKLPIASGLYPLKIYKGNKKLSDQVLNVLLTDSKLVGSVYNADGTGGYSVFGETKDNKISFTMNCSAEGAVFKCSRRFTGSLSGSLIKGDWKGTGGSGTWEIDRAGFAVLKEQHYLRDIGMHLSQAKISGSSLSSSADKVLIADNKKDRSFIRLIIREKPDIYFKHGSLILNAIRNDSDSDLRLILYSISKNNDGVIQPNKISEIASLKKGETGQIIADISSQIRLSDADGYLIGTESSGNASVVFLEDAAAELFYYRDMASYKPTETITGKIITFSGDDITGNYNDLRPDDEKDICAEVSVAAKGRVLEHIEVIAEGESVRRWNTNPFDIYPAVAVKYGGKLINNEDGSLSQKLLGDKETFRLFFYRGTLKHDDALKFTVRAVIDGKVYENVIGK